MKLKQILFLAIIFLIIAIPITPKVLAQTDPVIPIVFPVLGGAPYTDDYGDPRSGGRTHEGNDMFTEKMRPLLATTDGVINFITVNEPTWGWSLSILGDDGYEYRYLHLNNDTPGTDDGNGGYNNAFAAGIELGRRVIAGEVVGFLGDSGNAETTPPHLHFEIRTASGAPINPYRSLRAARVLGVPVINPNPIVVKTPRQNNQEHVHEDDGKNTASQTPNEIIPYQLFEGGANIASGSFSKKGSAEIVVGTAFGGGGRTIVRTYDDEGELMMDFFAYGDVFRGGVDVAAADVDGDGIDEIITAPGVGGGPHIKIFKANGTFVSDFMAYDGGFRGGVKIAAADIDGDGKVEIITAPWTGGGPHIKVFSSSGELKTEMMAYSSGFRGGVDVAAFSPEGRINGGFVTAPGPTGGPHVKVYSSDGKMVNEFMAYAPSFTGGVRIDAGNPVGNNGSFEIVVGPASNSSAQTKIFKTNGELIKTSYTGFEQLWTGGTDVAIVGREVFIASLGGRQTAVKKVTF